MKRPRKNLFYSLFKIVKRFSQDIANICECGAGTKCDPVLFFRRFTNTSDAATGSSQLPSAEPEASPSEVFVAIIDRHSPSKSNGDYYY
jgi:hypothetical protein